MKHKRLFALLLVGLVLCTGCTEQAGGEAGYSEQSVSVTSTLTQIGDGDFVSYENESVTLTMAVLEHEFGSENVWSDVILSFCEAQDDINIETKVYTEDDTLLRLALISGDAPDLIATGAFDNAEVLTAMGALLDLYTLLDSDSDYSRQDFLNLELLELDGKLTQISSQYYITSYYGTQEAYGTESGWNLEACLERISQADSPQDILGNITGSDFIAKLIRAYSSENVDYENAACNFDTEEFRAMLDIASAIQMEGQEVNVYTTQTQTMQEFFSVYPEVIYPCRIAGVSEFTTFLNNNAGIDVNLMGMPCSEGNGAKAAFLQPISVYAMTEYSKECWKFIKYFMTNEEVLEDTSYFPVYRPYLEQQIQDSIVDEVARNQDNPQSLFAASALGVTVKPQFTAEESELLKYLLYEGPSRYGYDPVVSPIVLEEMEDYLSGEKTQDEVISIIENRLTIYLSEIQ